MTRHKFPDGFLWGAATSALQIEGAADAAGRGESIWDRFAATPGKIEDGSNARVACDHYNRWRDDIGLMKWLGLDAYRFSIAWPRILPAGTGEVNHAGLDFYDQLVDGLLEAGIEPFVTLYHWDLPQALEDRGGWGNRETVDAFTAYTDAVVARLGDRVRYWTTHNEPWCIAALGHEEGAHAPGHKDPGLALRAAHHLLLSHGRAVGVIRARRPDAMVGIVLNLTPAFPETEGSAGDIDAARQFDGFFNRWYLDPLFHGNYPKDAIDDRVRCGHLEEHTLPFVEEGDMETIAAPLDYLGVNYYSRVIVNAGRGGQPRAVPGAPAGELTDMGWEVFPRGLDALLIRIHREYAPREIYITENGAAYVDDRDEHGRIMDRRRIEYFRGHLAAAGRAIAAGVPLSGYFAWSLLDNFEWAYGYTKRFGLFEVDYTTQKRTPKESAFWYRDVAQGNGFDDLARDLRHAEHPSRRIP